MFIETCRKTNDNLELTRQIRVRWLKGKQSSITQHIGELSKQCMFPLVPFSFLWDLIDTINLISDGSLFFKSAHSDLRIELKGAKANTSE